MTNKIFLDSSVLVEPLRGRHIDFLSSFLESDDFSCCTGETVISEFMFYVLGTNGGASPKTLQQGGKVSAVLAGNTEYSKIFKYLEFLITDASLFSEVPRLMTQYNLLPNDAIILATCILHNVKFLATHDSDFDIACKAEGITLLKDLA